MRGRVLEAFFDNFTQCLIKNSFKPLKLAFFLSKSLFLKSNLNFDTAKTMFVTKAGVLNV